MGKLDCRRVIYQYSSTINIFQGQICCLNYRTSERFQKCYFFVIHIAKRKWKNLPLCLVSSGTAQLFTGLKKCASQAPAMCEVSASF